MATQTRTRRQAAANKAAATRKQNAADASAASAKTSARQTKRSAAATGREAKRTAKQAGTTTSRRIDAATSRLDAIGRQAERAFLIQIGAALEARDAVLQTAQTYTDPGRLTRELDRFEQRGERALRQRRRDIDHKVRNAQREAGRQATDAKEGAKEVIDTLQRLV